MKPQTILSLLVGMGLLLTLAPAGASRGAAATTAYTFGAPELVLTRPHAIGIAGWQPDDQLRLTLNIGPQSQAVYFTPATGELTSVGEHAAWGKSFLEAQWSPDGRFRATILTPGSQAGAPLLSSHLQLFDALTGQQRRWDGAPRFVTDLAWAPNSQWLAVLAVTEITAEGAERAQLFLVDALTGEASLAREELFGGGMWGQQLAWSPDGRQLAVACPTAEEGRVCLLPVSVSTEPPALTPAFTGAEPTPEPSTLPPLRATAPYTPPTEITLSVYQLTLGGVRRSPYTLCEPGSTAWGCTVFCDENDFPCVRTTTLPYPYATNPITLPIESDYLLDVVPLEMGTYYHATALIAQAVAARSYAYRAIYDGRAINNSTAFQAFIPYKFESLPPARFPDNPTAPCAATNLNARQRLVCDAVAPGYYIAYDLAPEDYVPAFAEFSADAWLRTVNGGRVYLRGVEDPISSGCDANNYGHQRGMSQEGASRWARGNRCSYAGAGDEPWSVRWDDARQILTHYYTGVQLRDSSGTRLTPDYRWAPLEVDWRSGSVNPPLLQPEETRALTFTLQNTGVFTWTGNVSLAYYGWEDENGVPVITATTSVTLLETVAPGASLRVGLPLTAPPQTEASRHYRLRFDMLLHEEGRTVGFSIREPERPWPVYTADITVMQLPHKVYLPLVQRN